jgi:hypothetical protein
MLGTNYDTGLAFLNILPSLRLELDLAPACGCGTTNREEFT